MTPELLPPAMPVDRGRHEILVVDDDPAGRYATARLLRSVGFRTREAATGSEALRMTDERLSAVVLDVNLPDIDGFEACRILRSRAGLARLPVLHLTAAYVTDEDKVRGLDSGADAYLTHPVEPAVIVATVQALVRARMAEDALRQTEARFRAIYAGAPTGITLLDEQGCIVEANKAMLELVGRDAADLKGRCIADLVAPEASAEVHRRLSGPVAEAWAAEWPLLDSRGRVLQSEWRVTPLGEANLRLAMTLDISDRIALEQARAELLEREQAARAEAERISRSKDELIAVLSHELRSPLNAIMSWAHVLQRMEVAPEVRRGLEAIERNGRAQARLLADILDASRINMGKLRLRLQPTDLAELLRSVLETLRPSLEEREADIVLQIDGPNPRVRVDRERFQQIVWNLLSNAKKFSPPGTPITISLTPHGDRLRLTVADQGVGVPGEFLPFMFDRFSQRDATSNRQHGGLGLGLAIIEQLVQMHGAEITARSDGEGRGTAFDIDFVTMRADEPADAGEADAPDTAWDDMVDEAGELEGITVLVVDDDAEACATLDMILSERGGVVSTARSYDEAMAALERRWPDVIVCDLGMPGRNGFDLLRHLRQTERSGRRTPAVALSAFSRPGDVQRALAAGFDLHCAKPLRPAELLRAIGSLTGRAAADAAPARTHGDGGQA